MVTPDLLEELLIWENDSYFLESIRSFHDVHEQTVSLGYDLTVPNNELIFHTGNFVSFSILKTQKMPIIRFIFLILRRQWIPAGSL